MACVVGELKRHLRDTSWRLHVPRPLKERALWLCRAAKELHQHLGRFPTTMELAEQLQVDEEAVLEGLAALSAAESCRLTSRSGVAKAPRLSGDLVAAAEVREAARIGFSQMHISRLQRRALAACARYRNHAADERERDADDRDRIADERDRVADERDRTAGHPD